MPLFGSNQGSSLFSTVKSGLSSLFGGINRGAGSVGDVANKAGSLLGTISNIAKNPIVQTIAGSLGQVENLNKFANATSQGANLAQKVGGISQKVADVTSPSTYFGQGAIPATKNAIERSKDIFSSIKGLVSGNVGGNPYLNPNVVNVGGVPTLRPMGANPATYSPMPMGMR